LHGNALRAAVLGAGDGLLTNVSLVLGVAAAGTGASFVRLAGTAGLLAGAFSMAAGELVSVRAQDELRRREIDVEAAELRDEPEAELRELAAMYRTRGVPAGDAMTVAKILSANHELALDTHARLELGIDPGARGSSVRASLASFVAFAFGAVLPWPPPLWERPSACLRAGAPLVPPPVSWRRPRSQPASPMRSGLRSACTLDHDGAGRRARRPARRPPARRGR
jgi:hypothetical protein